MKKLLLMLETPISVMCAPSLNMTIEFPPEVEALPDTGGTVYRAPIDWVKLTTGLLPVEVAPSSQWVSCWR